MSIVYDFPAINSRLRGDDWWEPAALVCEPVESKPRYQDPRGGSGSLDDPRLLGVPICDRDASAAGWFPSLPFNPI